MAEKMRDEGDLLYEKYGKPLEADHWGEFVAIFPNGATVLGEDMDSLAWEALERVGQGAYMFKVGDRVVGNIR